MKHVVLPENKTRRLPFYLAAEEFVARQLPADEYFFIWRVKPTVICGRNQSLDLEVDLEYCRSKRIDVCRRRSGGGCVYADLDNLMFSYITPSEDVTTTFLHYTSMVARMLRSLGLNAEATGRNDILIDGRKVSGNAFYHIPGRSIVHGTMLYDTDLTNMLNAITPSRAKLESKQVQSVASRITMLNRYLHDIDIDTFRQYAINQLTDGRLILDDEDVRKIELIERNYHKPQWLYGRRQIVSPTKHFHEDGIGDIDIRLETSDGKIDEICLSGDFFQLGDTEQICCRLRGRKLDRHELQEALSDTDCSKLIAGLSTGRMIEMIIS